MTHTSMDVTTIEPFTHHEAMRLQANELSRTLTALRTLDESDWHRATDCPAWDVRALYQHVLGACESGASIRESVHQMRLAMLHRRRNGGPLEAALSHVQVSERADLTPAQIVDRIANVAPKTVRTRTRLPALLRDRARMPIDGPVIETWTVGFLVDTIYLRDLWMHRIDLARAVRAPLELSAEHDGRIVADVVAEWARRHQMPFILELTGDAGGTYTHNPASADAERISLDAVTFCRTLAGREPADGLLKTIVPF